MQSTEYINNFIDQASLRYILEVEDEAVLQFLEQLNHFGLLYLAKSTKTFDRYFKKDCRILACKVPAGV